MRVLYCQICNFRLHVACSTTRCTTRCTARLMIVDISVAFTIPDSEPSKVILWSDVMAITDTLAVADA